MAKWIQTIKGPVAADTLGLVLPHEHLFTDLRGPLAPGYAQADPDLVVSVIEPYLTEAYSAGVRAMAECSTVGVGRNITLLRRLADLSPIHLIAPTGIYRDAFTPSTLRDTSTEILADLWTRELLSGMEGTAVRAGFIKLAVSDDGPTTLEIRNLRAAVRASAASGAVIACHTVGGNNAIMTMDILEDEGLDLGRFIWVHAQTEDDVKRQLEAARRGAYLEIDSIGGTWQPQAQLLRNALGILDAGYVDHLLLSHDAGWFDPSSPDGLPDDGFRGYTALTNAFLPAMRAHGVSEEEIQRITIENPAKAFGSLQFQ